MSHTSAIRNMKITSVSALRAAVADLVAKGIRCSLVENSTPRAYYPGQQGMGKADFVLKLDDAKYDVGLYRQEDGSYEARTDFFMGSVAKCLGGTATTKERAEQAQMGKLFQAYGVQAAMERARKNGFNVQRTVVGTKVMLEITGATM